MKGVSYSSLGGRRRGRKTRGRRSRGGSAKDVADSIISQLESSANDVPEGVEEDVTVTVSVPSSPSKVADIDELIQKLREYKDTTSVTGKAKAIVSGLKGKLGSLFSKGQSAGAVTEALEGYLTTLKTADSVDITTVPSTLGDYVDRLKAVTAATGGRSRKSRRYTRRR